MRRYDFIDLRKELAELKAHAVHKWVALRSVDLSKPCNECKAQEDPNYDQPAAYCKTCMSMGYSYIDKLVKGYRFEAAPGFDTKSNIGILNLKTQVYILEHGAVPKPVDWILELDMNEVTMVPKTPFKITNSFKIENALDMRDKDGRIEFWRCYVRERNLDLGKRIA